MQLQGEKLKSWAWLSRQASGLGLLLEQKEMGGCKE